MANNGLIFDIQRFAVHDGPGIRTTVFMKGCPLGCWWCHNPEGISAQAELAFFEYSCIHCRSCVSVCPQGAIDFASEIFQHDRQRCTGCGLCAGACPTGARRLVGRIITVDQLMEEIERDTLLYDSSDGGVTFSGGEPLSQPRFLEAALQKCKDRGLHTALDTSGYAPADVFASLMGCVDLFLYDLKLADEDDHIRYTGVSNKLIKQNLRALDDAGRGGDLILRIPVIPGITDTEKNIAGLRELVASLKRFRQIELLSYHDVCEKYDRLGRRYEMPTCNAPTPRALENMRDALLK